MKLEALSLEKFKKNEVIDLVNIIGGLRDPDTGCSDVQDCCTGDECGDSRPYEPENGD